MIKIKKYINEIKIYLAYIITILIFICILNYTYFKELLYILLKPINPLLKNNYMIYTNLTDVITNYIKIFIITTIIICIPLCCYQFFLLIANSLYKNEKKKIINIIKINSIVLILSLKTIYITIIPNIWLFFLKFQEKSKYDIFNLYFEGKIDKYFDLMLTTFINLYALMYLPFITYLLIKNLEIKKIINNRKNIYLTLILTCSLIAPPEITNYFLIIFFLTISFEFILMYIIILEKYKNSEKET